MVFLLDSIIEYLTKNPQDFETAIFIVGVCILCLGLDLIFGAVVIFKVFEYLGDCIDSYYNFYD